MSADSTTSGPLAPVPTPAPLEGQDLLRFLQQFIVGITGMDGTRIRPRWQTEPPNIPTAGSPWAAIGITRRIADTYAYLGHAAAGDGSDEMQRHETLEILCSFYDTGAAGQADALAALLRDGVQVPQNREVLLLNGMALIETGDLVAVPSLMKNRWLYRVDLPLSIRRQISRTYPVLNVVSSAVHATVIDDTGVVP